MTTGDVGPEPAAPDAARIPASMLDEPPDALLAWAHRALTAAGYRISADPPEIRRRSWSTVIRIGTDRGAVWAKSNPRAFAHEAGLLLLLVERAPALVLRPIAVQPALGWLLSPDGGPTLRATGPVPEATAGRLLADYARLQRSVAPDLSTLLRLGLRDMTPGRLARWYRRAVDRVDAEPLVAAKFDGGRRRELADLIPWTERWSAELASSSLPTTVEHNDLHTDNIFAGTAANPGPRIFDWGDAIVAHPFLGLGRSLRMATPDDVDRVRDAYLRVWQPAGSTDIPASHRRAAQLAEPLANVALAASWLRLPLGFDDQQASWYAQHLIDYLEQSAGLRP